jgi:hypothetical protein
MQRKIKNLFQLKLSYICSVFIITHKHSYKLNLPATILSFFQLTFTVYDLHVKDTPVKSKFAGSGKVSVAKAERERHKSQTLGGCSSLNSESSFICNVKSHFTNFVEFYINRKNTIGIK